MSHLEFFKKQAKNLLKDWQTQTKTVDSDGFISYRYDWKFFDVGDLFFYYEFDNKDEQEIILARAQHLIAKMVGFKKWDDLIHASEPEQELAEILLRRFKDSQDIQKWEDYSAAFSGFNVFNAKDVVDIAKDYYAHEDALKIINLSPEKITILSGKPKTDVINRFDDEHNPAGSLRKTSTVYCPHCNKSFIFSKSKVIKDNDKNLALVVCKNYPDCHGTYLDYRVMTPSIIYGEARIPHLKEGLNIIGNFEMNSKVECIHCGDKFLYNEATVVISPRDGEAYIECKNYPKCDGSLIDMMPVEE